MNETRLAYVCGNPTYTIDAPSGYSTRMRELCRGFEALGWSTRIELPNQAAKWIADAKTRRRSLARSIIPPLLWETLRNLYYLRSNIRYAKTLADVLRKNRVDIVYECLEFPGSVADHLPDVGQKLFVLEIHNPLDEDDEYTSGVPRALSLCFMRRVRRAIHRADFIVVISGVVRDWVIAQGGKVDNIIVLPNGVNLEQFDPAKYALKKPTDTNLVVGFVGSDLEFHRLPALVDAFALLPPTIPAELHIVGMAAANENLRTRVRERKIEHRVRFPGVVPFDQVPAAIASFDIAVMPGSNRYGSPLKIFEYGAMGKAIIAPDVAPVREVMVEGKDALFVPSGDVEALKHSLLRLLQENSLRANIALHFQQKVRSMYGWRDIAKKIADRMNPSLRKES